MKKLHSQLKDLEERVSKNEGGIESHSQQIEDILKMLAAKADKSDVDILQSELDKVLSDFSKLKELVIDLRGKVDELGLLKSLKELVNDLDN